MKWTLFFNLIFVVPLLYSHQAESPDWSSIQTLEPIAPVVVIGSGPAGLGAAFVTAHDKVPTVVFQGAKSGGPLNSDTHIDNWPAYDGVGNNLMIDFMKQVKKKGAQLSSETIVQVDFSHWPFTLWTKSGTKLYALAVVVATGATPRHLHVEGETEYEGRGIEHDVFNDQLDKFKGKRVAVIGSGRDAYKKARNLCKVASEVFLIVRGDRLKQLRWSQKAHEIHNLHIVYNTQVQKIVGNGDSLNGIELNENGKVKNLSIDSLVLAVGLIPNSSLFKEVLSCDHEGYILTESPRQKTNIAGVFACGNVSDPLYHQSPISMGDGMKAGYDALQFLKEMNYLENSQIKLKEYKP